MMLLIILFSGCEKSATQSDKLLISASIPPIAEFVRQIGGDHVKVFTVVEPGTSPHTFELTPQMMRTISHSRLLVVNGLGLESWVEKVLDAVGGSLTLVIASDGIEAIERSHDHAEADDHDHGDVNPHVWLNPVMAMIQVENILRAMIDVAPEFSIQFAENGRRYLESLGNLDQDIKAEVVGWRYKKFICFHPAWEYFADRYGLEQAAVVAKRPGIEPTPKELGHVIETVYAVQAKAIFAEPQFPESHSRMIAKETGVEVLYLDPLGGTRQSTDYPGLMLQNVAEMARALK